MAAYPVFPTSYGSDPKPINSLVIDRTEDGVGRARSFYSVDKVTIQVKHPRLSASDKSTLDAFYVANRLLPFDYTSLADGVTRSCMFVNPPAYTRLHGDFYDATVEMAQV